MRAIETRSRKPGDETMNATFATTEPRQIIKDLLKTAEDARGWKWPISPITFVDGQFAHEVAEAMTFYYGGHEMVTGHDTTGAPVWIVGSKGYYHYVGA